MWPAGGPRRPHEPARLLPEPQRSNALEGDFHPFLFYKQTFNTLSIKSLLGSTREFCTPRSPAQSHTASQWQFRP